MKNNKKLDREIARLYSVHSQGRQIDILKIPQLFAAVRDAHAKGEDLESAVKAAILHFTQEAA